uniref:Uncharacterized protein n=1 Tax=Anopheles culicifacies TaxID=139723 RepID=A0A182MS51_9DIPT
MRQANSVKIAKIIAITVVLSSFILGSFILASSYLQAKQSCDQMQALDAVLNKELMLEAMQQMVTGAALVEIFVSPSAPNARLEQFKVLRFAPWDNKTTKPGSSERTSEPVIGVIVRHISKRQLARFITLRAFSSAIYWFIERKWLFTLKARSNQFLP